MQNLVLCKRLWLTMAATTLLATIVASPLKRISPEKAGMIQGQLSKADSAIQDAISRELIPGAVLAVVRHGKMAYLKAYGNRQVWPTKEPMHTNVVFDMASCSKAMSTAICTLILCEQGAIRLQDAVNLYLPDFENWTNKNGERKTIRISHLLTHTSGLPAYTSATDLQKKHGAPCPDALLSYICHAKRGFEPEKGFRYSCLNYIVLQRIIEKVSGTSLREFAQRHIFRPLDMHHTDYLPCAPNASGIWENTVLPVWAKNNDKVEEWKRIVAPTTQQTDGTLLQAMVHDPLARLINGGISGNAGLFSNAEDIAVFCAMLQNGGEWKGVRILSKQGVALLRTVPDFAKEYGRTYGWDNSSPYASCNGDLFSAATYSHTGFTGTSIVIDPVADCSVILLTHAVHPSEGKSVVRLRSIVSNAVAASLTKE